LLSYALLTGHACPRFLIRRPAHEFVSWSGSSLQGYRQLNAGCLRLKLQTNRLVLTAHFYNHKTTTKRPLIQILCFPSVTVMALRRNVLQEDDILWELYADTRSDVFIVTMKVWTVMVTSPQLGHVNNCDLLLLHWPHNFHTHFSSHISRQLL